MTDDENEIETVEKLEETKVGYRFSVKSKRGTGTNDRDEVEAELLTEERPTQEERYEVLNDVTDSVNYIRMNQPDDEDS